jgi:ribosomal protein S18 acetylase RimI-like enzyme
VSVRVLTEADTAAFQAMRLRALKEHPEAFGSSFEAEVGMALEQFAKFLSSPDSPWFGAFRDDQLLGVAGLMRSQGTKTRHRAMISGMYVVPEGRGLGLGQALVDAVMNRARATNGLEDVSLAVTVGNDAARHIYIKAGFTPYSIDPRYLKVGDQYFDIEWMILRVAQDG